jgi:hypothetical protein
MDGFDHDAIASRSAENLCNAVVVPHQGASAGLAMKYKRSLSWRHTDNMMDCDANILPLVTMMTGNFLR